MADQDRPGVPGYILLAWLASALSWSWGMHTIWIQHDVAGLAVLGLDYLTFVKILPAEDFTGWHRAAWVWSLPLTAASGLASQLAWAEGWLSRGPTGLKWVSRVLLALVAGYTAMQILPLDWSPGNLLTPTNLVQTLNFLLCTGLIAMAPLTGPWLIQQGHWWLPVAAAGCVPAVALGHFVYLPYFANLYRQELVSGPGPVYVMVASMLVLTAAAYLHLRIRLDRSQ